MIAKMLRVYVVARRSDVDPLLDALRELGVVHVVPVDPGKAVAHEKTLARIDTLHRAAQILHAQPAEHDGQTVEPTDMDPVQAAYRVVEIQRASVERSTRLAALHRQIEQLEMWGEMRLEQVEAIRQAGLGVSFWAVDPAEIGAIRAESVETVGEMPDGRTVVAAVVRGVENQPEAPESAERVPLPARDRPTLRAQAAEIDQARKTEARELAGLAHLADAMEAHRAEAQAEAEFTRVRRSGIAEQELFGLQGWVPADQADALSAGLSKRGIDAGVRTFEPAETDQPPTLVRYPRWVKPIKALFDLLGTVPGYREFDLSPFFMVAMPIFTAMLVGDAGYGLIFTILGAWGYRRLASAGRAPAGQMILVFAIATLIWGTLTGNWFGVAPREMIDAGGFWAGLGTVLHAPAVLWRESGEQGRALVMKISFVIGCIHLGLAHVRQAVAMLPDQRGIAEVGWVGFVFGMFTLVWMMFFGPLIPPTATLWLLAVSWVVIVLFCTPSRNPLKRIGLGVASNLMSITGAFGDMLSYIRLMAVGLASYYIASAFNSLGADMANVSPLVIPVAILVILFAHALNIGLCLVAVFAHGVRLNMLEFSMNAGVQWDGYPYAPFTKQANLEGDR